MFYSNYGYIFSFPRYSVSKKYCGQLSMKSLKVLPFDGLSMVSY